MKYKTGSVHNTPLAIKSIKDIMVVLKLSLRYAFSTNKLRSFDLAIKYPKSVNNNGISTLSKTEINRLVKSINKNEDQREIGVLIAILTGLRIGEICALKYSDICFKSNTITVSKTLQRIYTKEHKSKIIESSPKTNSSFRTIPLAPQLKNYLSKRSDDIYVLSNTLIPVEPRLLRKVFNRLLEQNNMKHYKFHSLRHTFATKCIEAKIDYKTISVLLGHANINTTLNLYVHPSYSQKKKAINKLTALLIV